MNEGWRKTVTKLNEDWDFLSYDQQKAGWNTLKNWAANVLDEWAEMNEACTELEHRLDASSEYIPYDSKGTALFELELYEEAAEQLELELQREEVQVLDLPWLYALFAHLYSGNAERTEELGLYLLHTNKQRLCQYFSYMALGAVNTQREKWDGAFLRFERAAALTKSPDVMYNLGMLSFILQEFKQAATYFHEVIQWMPDDDEARFYLGKCFFLLDENEKGESQWFTCLAQTERIDLLHSLALEFEWHGYHAEAVACYERLLSQGFEAGKHGLAWNYALSNKKEEALSLFHELINEEGEEEVATSISHLASYWKDEELQLL